MGVVAALAAEARTLGPARQRPDGLSTLSDGALLAVSGMGCPCAQIAAAKLADAGVVGLVSFGLAGGLDPALSAGTVVVPSAVISREGVRFVTASPWREQVRAAIAARCPPADGELLTCASPMGAIADKAAAFHETGAVAVDMESFAVAAVAAAHHLPFIAVRVIVDTAADALPRAVAGASRAGAVSLARLGCGLALAPGELFAVIRLAKRYRTAMRTLEAVAPGTRVA
ncbi:MAG: purine phosphorylase [Steroidobacteraceae bacterium]